MKELDELRAKKEEERVVQEAAIAEVGFTVRHCGWRHQFGE